MLWKIWTYSLEATLTSANWAANATWAPKASSQDWNTVISENLVAEFQTLFWVSFFACFSTHRNESFMGGSTGLVVMGGNSSSRGCELKSLRWLLDGSFFKFTSLGFVSAYHLGVRVRIPSLYTVKFCTRFVIVLGTG